MTGLLVSVRDAEEAQLAADAGVDLIDAKEPSRGSLGAMEGATLARVVERISGRVPVSAALGELLEGAELTSIVTYAKQGLAGCLRRPDWQHLWCQSIARLPAGVAPVAVVYADWRAAQSPEPDTILAAAGEIGCRMVLVDTFDKRGGSLLEIWGMTALERFVKKVRAVQMAPVLAGSLSAKTIRKVLPLEPAYVAVRGAAASKGVRDGKLDQQRVRELVAIVRETTHAEGRFRPAATASHSGRSE